MYVQFVSVLSVLFCPLSPVFLSLTYLSSPRTVGRNIVTAALNTTLLYSGERERGEGLCVLVCERKKERDKEAGDKSRVSTGDSWLPV